MSALFGSSEHQDVVPLPKRTSAQLDSMIRVGSGEPSPPRTPKPTAKGKPRDTLRRVVRSRSRSRSASGGDRRSHKRPKLRSRTRTYRPNSPTESVQSDFDIIANKHKLKDASLTTTTAPGVNEHMNRLSDDIMPDRSNVSSRSSRRSMGYSDAYSDDNDDVSGGDADDGFSEDDRGRGRYDMGRRNFDEEDFGGGDDVKNVFDSANANAGGGGNCPRLTYDQTIQQKAAILADLDRRTSSGERIEYSDTMTLEQLLLVKNKTIIKARSQHTVKLLRQGITMYAGLLEWASRRFPQLNMDLTDFSKDMFTKKNDYDDLLYEIYDMYADHMKMNPVVMLLMTITGQAAVYSAARNFAKNLNASMGLRFTPPPVASQAPQGYSPAVYANGPPAKQQQQQQQPMEADVDISGPSDGFDTAELLELCRKEAQAAAPSQGSSSSSSSSVGNVVELGQGEPDTIEVDIPGNHDASGGVQIIKNTAGAKKPRATRKKPPPVVVTATGAADKSPTAGTEVSRTDLWDAGID